MINEPNKITIKIFFDDDVYWKRELEENITANNKDELIQKVKDYYIDAIHVVCHLIKQNPGSHYVADFVIVNCEWDKTGITTAIIQTLDSLDEEYGKLTFP
jgi:hypothetical protein